MLSPLTTRHEAWAKEPSPLRFQEKRNKYVGWLFQARINELSKILKVKIGQG